MSTSVDGKKTGLFDPTNVAITGGSVAYTNNLQATQNYKFRAALARQATGGAFAKIALIGDSTTAGGISDPTPINYRPNSWGAKLSAMLSANGTPACMTNAIGNAAGVSGAGLSFGLWDSRITAAGAFANASSVPMAGGTSCSAAAAGSVAFAPGVSTDSVDIYFLDQNGSFTVNVDGGATLQTITLTSTFAPRKVTVNYTAGVHVINMVYASGTNWNFLGFDAYLSTSPQIHLLNLGAGGSTSQGLSASGNSYDPIPWYKYIAPDLTILSLGINDWLTGVTVSAYSANVQTIITACQLSGDVILMTPFPSDAGQAALVMQAGFVAAMRALAASNNILLIDENYNLVSKATMTARSLGADPNHPNGIGHAVIARDIKNVLAGLV